MVANRFGLLVLCFSDWFFFPSEVNTKDLWSTFSFKKQWKREASDFFNFRQPPNTLHIHSSDREQMWPEAHCHVREFQTLLATKAGLKKTFPCPLHIFFKLDPGANFLVAFSFIFVANVRQDSKSRRKKRITFAGVASAHNRTIINYMVTSSMMQWRRKKVLTGKSCAHFITSRPEAEWGKNCFVMQQSLSLHCSSDLCMATMLQGTQNWSNIKTRMGTGEVLELEQQQQKSRTNITWCRKL